MTGALRLVMALVAMASMVAGCAVFGPRVAPDGGPPTDPDIEPIGPVVEIGRGEDMGVAWRFSVYESRIGTCTRIEHAGRGGGPMSCGGSLAPGPGGPPVAPLGYGGGTDGPWDFTGFAREDVAEVWIELGDGTRHPATLMSLERIGQAGQIFYTLVPGDRGFSRLIGFDAAAVEIASVPIEGP